MKRFTWMWTAAALAIGLTGCSKSSGKLSVSAGAAQQAATDGGTDGGSSTSLDLGNGIVIDRVRVAVRELKLEREDGAGGADAGVDAGMDAGSQSLTVRASSSRDDHGGGGGGDGSGDDGEGHGGDEIELGPILVDLTGAQLASGISQVFSTDVPAGTYRELKISIGPVTSGSGSAGTTFPDLNGQSVIIDGTVDGTAFSYAAAITAQLKLEGDIVVAADGSFKNVTVAVDPAAWFKDAAGARLDPSLAANAATIGANIKASINAFDDDDHDGHDDHGEHGPGHK